MRSQRFEPSPIKIKRRCLKNASYVAPVKISVPFVLFCTWYISYLCTIGMIWPKIHTITKSFYGDQLVYDWCMNDNYTQTIVYIKNKRKPKDYTCIRERKRYMFRFDLKSLHISYMYVHRIRISQWSHSNLLDKYYITVREMKLFVALKFGFRESCSTCV